MNNKGRDEQKQIKPISLKGFDLINKVLESIGKGLPEAIISTKTMGKPETTSDNMKVCQSATN